MPAKLLVLGIDAASAALVDAWIRDGTLPNLAVLRARGLSGGIRGVEGFHIGATWPTLYTGRSPSEHGIHYTHQLEPGTYRFASVFERPSALPPFWETLSRAGRRVAVLDVPLSRPGPELNGMQVVEWAGHDAVFGFHAVPASLEGEIRSRFGAHPLGPSCDAPHRTHEDYRTFVDTLISGVQRKTQLTRYFLERESPDTLIQVFTEAHCAGHQCWHLHDTSHPAHDPAFVRAHGDPLRRVYAAIDAAVGDVTENAGHVLVFAAHGMSHWYGAQFLLPDILYRLGVAHPVSASPPGVRAAAFSSVRGVWRALPRPVRQVLEPVRRRARGEHRAQGPVLGVDPERSRCFTVPNGFAVGGIRLNLRGREPAGMLEPGDADDFCAELAAWLLEIVDERTGAPAIRRAVRTPELYTGEALHRLPDLLVEWDDALPTGSTVVGSGGEATVRLHSDRIGTVEGANHYGRTGEHRPDGWFIAAGPGVPNGVRSSAVSLIDIAPTITRWLGVGAPGAGTPIAELAHAAF